jgi:hypothetical protein
MLTLLKIKRGSGQCALCRARDKAHNRRGYFEAKDYEPELAEHALELIARLYAIEDDIRERALIGEDKRLYRLEHSKPITEVFFHWVDQQLQAEALKAKTPLTEALAYAHKRRAGLPLCHRSCRLDSSVIFGA